MKVVRLHRYNQRLVLENIPVPQVGRVEIHRAVISMNSGTGFHRRSDLPASMS